MSNVRRVLANGDRALHPGVEAAHEVQRRALLRGHVQLQRLDVLTVEDGAVARLAEAFAAVDENRLRLRVRIVRVDPVLLRELTADLAVLDLRRGLRKLRLLDEREAVRALAEAALAAGHGDRAAGLHAA